MNNLQLIKYIKQKNMQKGRGQPRKENKKATTSITLDPIIKGIVDNSIKDNDLVKLEIKKDFNKSNFISTLILYFFYNKELVKIWIEKNKDTLKDQI